MVGVGVRITDRSCLIGASVSSGALQFRVGDPTRFRPVLGDGLDNFARVQSG
jgi:hypothetical protein